MLTNILRNKGNQAIKLGLSIEYNLRNIFIAKLYTKCGGETTPRPFLKKIKTELACGSMF